MPGGYVFVTDFHPDAVAAGHQRTFTDQAGTVHEIEHYVHSNHTHLAEAAGLSLVACRDGVVGPSIRDFYVRGIGLKAFKKDTGLKLVAAFLFRAGLEYDMAPEIGNSVCSTASFSECELSCLPAAPRPRPAPLPFSAIGLSPARAATGWCRRSTKAPVLLLQGVGAVPISSPRQVARGPQSSRTPHPTIESVRSLSAASLIRISNSNQIPDTRHLYGALAIFQPKNRSRKLLSPCDKQNAAQCRNSGSQIEFHPTGPLPPLTESHSPARRFQLRRGAPCLEALQKGSCLRRGRLRARPRAPA